MSISVFALAAVLLGAASVHGQPASAPLDVSLCDLVQAPENYDHKRVRLRGNVDLQFENFTLDHTECGFNDSVHAVWLEYGGDEETSTVYCCGDHSKKPGSAVHIEGQSIGFVRDRSLDLFVSRLNAKRQALPNGDSCPGRACYLYDVTATLTGVFLAEPSGQGPELGGYGHMGCCHLLTIEQVSDVSTTRTAAPAGETYRCSTETRQAPPELGRQLVDAQAAPCLDGYAACEKNSRGLFTIAADYWGDPADTNRGSPTGWVVDGDRQSSEWMSADLVLKYKLTLPYPTPVPASDQLKVALAREHCEALTAPAPPDATTSCRTYKYGPFIPGEAPAAGPSAHGDVVHVGPKLLAQRAATMQVVLADHLSMTCDTSVAGADFEFGFCYGASSDGLQRVQVAFSRTARIDGGDSALWTALRTEITTCRIRTEP